MPFYEYRKQYTGINFNHVFSHATSADVDAVLAKQSIDTNDYLVLLSDAAAARLEDLAQKTRTLTQRHFGNAVVMYTPLYLSNHCVNECAYCSFSKRHAIERRTLSFDDVGREAEEIARTGMRHVLILTGESRKHTPPRFVGECVAILRDYFASITIEIYALSAEEYGDLIDAGVDGLTIYQETYDEKLYADLHAGGPKADYRFRIEAPERALSQNIRSVNIGALLGLHDPRIDAFFTGLHAAYLQKTFPAAEVAVSFPRLRPLVSEFSGARTVADPLFVQLLCAFRLFCTSAGITISTRESSRFRGNILPLGVTRMSAGSSTAVGGRIGEATVGQFEIADTRSVAEVRDELVRLGYQPVMHDWNNKMYGERV
ncbi:MAG: thiamine biosynthesis protein ThiH [Candidatus Raymondbacteria bacterium RifOxyC12_full_50_8]|uniref:Thiamine biosynthesis protein ThiH n=1 Tax=Candidatus Raymondbacteria bacterium RIFOXYD12_FULL_49_13 TaxID=1817890 RepID=A0A1F7FC78_UNCRA|nr:MAG: thiamine biosynthesis protein ThiH [Candidatus Raymondbacteria bacterium RIFOXYA2_FULL_49_16]OGJ93456.1 MAG: thiamine biosynthesis protein ThiH [Candidatus Raymondbacteria bacterium RifOxyB12_full_50_8]OGK04284.1 MAG: thiamine biosynthesis protein ThiH [Candidatus Raymondbacteria bacterium RIFOXYD12_FULL_49_13]OGK07980.1 MAG: thiamine biosynthesis protein ThiH [Candidatus Raymondbacteria bacterium RifOxyC12_full_50_8]OGP42432.1 MAG: thiamine biosynthesis protein ThiH [Candidatus Raymond